MNNTKFCSNCGKELDIKLNQCPYCNVHSTHQTIFLFDQNKRNQYLAAILAFLLGFLGVHKFYLGKKTAGIIYLCLFWTAIPALISFFECIYYLIMSQESFDNKYNNPKNNPSQTIRISPED